MLFQFVLKHEANISNRADKISKQNKSVYSYTCMTGIQDGWMLPQRYVNDCKSSFHPTFASSGEMDSCVCTYKMYNISAT